MKKPNKRSGTQLSKRKWQPPKRVSIWVVIALISICAIATYSYMRNNRRDNHLFSNVKWSMSFEQCQQMIDHLHVKSKVVLEEEQEIICTITDYEGREDIDGLVSFSCKEDGLEQVEVYIINRRGKAYPRQAFIHDYVKWLDGICGKHNKDSVVYSWSINNTQIELVDYPNKPVCIRYKWVNKE